MNNDCLYDTQHAERFDLLIKRLQQRRRRFGMEHGARMRLEGNYSRNSFDRPRLLDDRLYDELMAKMQAVEHAEGQHSWARNLGVVGTMEEPHRKNLSVSSCRVDFIFHLSFFISHSSLQTQ